VTTHQFPKVREERDREEFIRFAESCPPGLIGIVCGEQSRWAHFTLSIARLMKPQGSVTIAEPGLDITRQCNTLVGMVRQTSAEWLWLMGDDHVFDPDILFRLLKHDVDVVVPNVLQRSAPFYPVVYEKIREEDGHHMIKFDLPEHGLHEVFAAGSAGMLIRRRVIEALPAEPFQRWGHLQNEDLEFCRLTREAGFKIYVDVDTPMGHVGTMVTWPRFDSETGTWEADLTIGPGNNQESHRMPIRRLSPGSPSLSAA